MEIDDRLAELRGAIEQNKVPHEESVRTILSWFGALRRGSQVLARIDRALAKHKLVIRPPLSEPWIDATVTITLDEARKADAPSYDALIPRLAHLNAANQTPASVNRDEQLEVATAIMLRHDYSQLPVMPNEFKADGFVSWRTVGESIALGHEPSVVRDCMESEVRILAQNTPLTAAIDVIAKHEFVMVKGADGRITGPVTTTDLSIQYNTLAAPFLLIGEIESAIRRILDAHAPIAVLQAAKHGDDDRQVERPEDLTFSEYKAVFAHDEVWPKLGLKISKAELMKLLEAVRIARNDVMHFHPDDHAEEAVVTLRNAARTLSKIAKATVPRSAVR